MIGLLLDPRFKNITLSKYNEREIKVLKDGLIELMEMVEEQATEEGSHGTTCTITTTTLSTLTKSGDSATPPATKKEKLTALDKLFGPEQLSQEPITLENELEKYLAEAPIPRKENPLTWWKANTTSTRFKLCHLLQDNCCVCLLPQHQQKGFFPPQD